MAVERAPIPQQFATPEAELAYLRERLRATEHELGSRGEKNASGKAAEEVVREHTVRAPEEVLPQERILPAAEAEAIALNLSPEKHDDRMGEFLGLLQEKGIKNALAVIEQLKNPHLADDFHRFLIAYVKGGHSVYGLKERGELWKSLHMTLYEVFLPEAVKEELKGKTLKELLSSMEQFFAGMASISDISPDAPRHWSAELALADSGSEVVFYVAVPDIKKDLFEKQLLSVFPKAELYEQKDDHNVFSESGFAVGAVGALKREAILPLKTYDAFDYDPLNIILNTFAKLAKEGEGAAIQFVFDASPNSLVTSYRKTLEEVEKGKSLKDAFSASFGREFTKVFGEFMSGKSGEEKEKHVDSSLVEAIRAKIASPIIKANIRLVASAADEARAGNILNDMVAAFRQFENTTGNALVFDEKKGGRKDVLLKSFSYRLFNENESFPLSLREATTLMHLPSTGMESSPHLKQAKSGSAPAPVGLPTAGTLLGINHHRNTETKVYLTKEDRLRHFYVIGQTGTGKTTLLKNMIAQDIRDGEGVCMIDPHGTDIQDVLGLIPDSRKEDVIYFDPSNMNRVMGLNMLEYDPRYPEQKTFVVNELFSIFQKLYGAVPESMGPMFEQYFRNATLLVLEDPASGNTLLDVSRVLADADFRKIKLSKSKNPVINQFWEEIAEKTGGEVALSNIVPYITSKFDIFTANDFMRPIIAQTKSSFNFREIMDTRKILLVNLAKGRLGAINSNLLGLIIVGKILMSALSRVDIVGKGEVAPFYLYIDEFQNVTTDSISTILSEARKYKLSLTVAHQFIAQLEEGIRNAVFGNVGSMAAFRVGPEDTEFLQQQFAPIFTANDLMNIDNFNAYVRLLANGRPAKPFNIRIPAKPEGNPAQAEALKELSALKYGRPREEVEAEVAARYNL
ncbi:MAG: ATP-binding protein [Parcubacteria group bacterium]|nr:ATP-binding protein [Parcubacteria group bacterium]